MHVAYGKWITKCPYVFLWTCCLESLSFAFQIVSILYLRIIIVLEMKMFKIPFIKFFGIPKLFKIIWIIIDIINFMFI